MKLIFTLFYFLAVWSNAAYSQNKIYLQDEVKDGKVIEITPDEIKYKDPSNSTRVNSVPRNKTFLLFNDKGGFLVVSKPDSSNLFLSKSLIDNFINPQNDIATNTDRIFTRDKKIINCTIINEDIISLIINLNGVQLKVDKPTVAAVIYKNGEHKITSDIETATNVLYTFQLQNKLNSRTISPVKVTDPVKELTKDVDLKKEKNELAQKKKPESAYQKQTPTERRKAIADSILAAAETDKRYTLIVGNANSLSKRGEYSTAKYFYQKAHELKPNESEPLDGIESMNKKLLALDKLRRDSAEYIADITAADSLIKLKKWDSALVIYRNAAAIRSQEYYPLQKIKYVQSQINRLKAEEARRESEAKFNNAMARADIAVKEKRYEDALADYNEALTIHPDNKYAIDRAKILTYQVGLKKKAKDQ
jgi:tetratricopeptide (TPR) repeat protein